MTPERPDPPLWRRALRVVWLVAVLAVVAFVLIDRWEEVGGTLAEARAGLLALAGLLAVAAIGATGAVWRSLLAGVGSWLPVRAAVGVFYVGQLGKYLPGSVWPVLAQAELGRDHAVPARASFAAIALFMWTHLLTGVAVAAVALPFAGVAPWPALFLVVPALALLAPPLLARVLALGLRLARRQPLAATPDARAMVRAVGWTLVMWGCYGAHLAAAVAALGGSVTLPLAVGAFALAWCAGFVFVIAPAGAGVREAVLVGLLLPTLATGPALAATLLSRLLVTAGDVIWGLVGLAVSRGSRRGGPLSRPDTSTP